MEANRTSGVPLRIRVLAFSLRHAPRLTESIANQAGRVMTSKIGRRVASGVLGREYDLLGARTGADCFNIAKTANPSNPNYPSYIDHQRSILESKDQRAHLLIALWHGRRINNDRESTGSPQNDDTDNRYDFPDYFAHPRDLGDLRQRGHYYGPLSYVDSSNLDTDNVRGYLLSMERTGWNPTDSPEPPQKK